MINSKVEVEVPRTLGPQLYFFEAATSQLIEFSVCFNIVLADGKLKNKDIILNNPLETEAIAKIIGQKAQAGDV